MKNFISDVNSWVVRDNGFEVVAVGYEQRGCFGVPVTAEGISTTVAMIQLGRYGEGCYVSLTRPNKKELDILKSIGWEYDGAFAFCS